MNFLVAFACLTKSNTESNVETDDFQSSTTNDSPSGQVMGYILVGSASTDSTARAAASRGIPVATPTVRAARTAVVQWVPHSCVLTSIFWFWQITQRDSRSGHADLTSSARRKAPSAVPYDKTRPEHFEAIEMTKGSSAFRTAIPSWGRHAISLAFSSAIAPIE